VLLACFLGAAAGYLLLGLSWNIYVVILSRIPSALFKHTLDVIKVAVTDSVDPASRAAAIGRLNAAANTGFIIGPAVGGYVSAMPNGFNYTALLTTAIFLFNYALISLYFVDHMPADTLDKRHPRQLANAHAPIDWKAMLIHSKDKLLGFREIVNESGAAQTLLLARLLLSMAALLYRSHFSILLEDKFGTDAQQRGYLLSYMGLLGALASSAVGIITRVLRSERLVLQVAAVIYVLTFFALSRATSIVAVYVILMPQVVSIRWVILPLDAQAALIGWQLIADLLVCDGSLLRATSMALQTTFVSQEHVGAFMGISSSLTVRARQL
jgi:MFS family permease